MAVRNPFLHAALQRFRANPRGRDMAVGDIHGSFSALQRGLEAIAFDPAVDRLFSVGDLVDRGPESDQVLQWLDKPWFHAIGGNHDLLAWRSALGTPHTGVDHQMHGGEWLQDLDAGEQRRIGERLAALPLVFEIETPLGLVGMVHADCPFDDWRQMHQLNWDMSDEMIRAADDCLWSIERFQRRHTGVVKNIRAVVHGHMTLPAMLALGNVYYIDTGGWRPKGRFTFLELATLRPIKV